MRLLLCVAINFGTTFCCRLYSNSFRLNSHVPHQGHDFFFLSVNRAETTSVSVKKEQNKKRKPKCWKRICIHNELPDVPALSTVICIRKLTLHKNESFPTIICYPFVYCCRSIIIISSHCCVVCARAPLCELILYIYRLASL